jgi:hypothetical protein
MEKKHGTSPQPVSRVWRVAARPSLMFFLVSPSSPLSAPPRCRPQPLHRAVAPVRSTAPPLWRFLRLPQLHSAAVINGTTARHTTVPPPLSLHASPHHPPPPLAPRHGSTQGPGRTEKESRGGGEAAKRPAASGYGQTLRGGPRLLLSLSPTTAPPPLAIFGESPFPFPSPPQGRPRPASSSSRPPADPDDLSFDRLILSPPAPVHELVRLGDVSP